MSYADDFPKEYLDKVNAMSHSREKWGMARPFILHLGRSAMAGDPRAYDWAFAPGAYELVEFYSELPEDQIQEILAWDKEAHVK